MSKVTLRPNATASTEDNPEIVGGSTIHGVLADASDESYVLIDDDREVVTVELDDYAAVAGSVVKRIHFRARAANPQDRNVNPPVAEMWLEPTPEDPFFSQDVVLFASDTPVDLSFQVWDETFADSTLDSLAVALSFPWMEGSTTSARIIAFYLDVTYVEQPEVSATAPSGTLEDTNRPLVKWTPELDLDGGAQTAYEVKVFDKATYEGGGFDPDTSIPVAESSVTSGNGTSWQTDPLGDGDYRAYVRIAQTVNSAKHWSEWEFSAFTVDVVLPPPPALTLTPEDGQGRSKLEVAEGEEEGAATTDDFEVQWSHDGETWTPLRTAAGGGILDGTSATAWDYEAPNGEAVSYRVRARHNYSGLYAVSLWTEGVATWESGDRWLKHPTDPSRNVKVEIASYGSYDRRGRRGVFQPLGRTTPVVVSDTRMPRSGRLVLDLDDEAAGEALDALLDTLDPLLLQMASGDRRPDRWVVLGDSGRAPHVDKLAVADTLETLEWTEVERP